MNKTGKKITVILFLVIIYTFTIISIVKKPKTYSENENRLLAQKPKVNVDTVLDGTLEVDYEKYLLDQFVFRDSWINIKTNTELLLGKNEINNVYLGLDGYLFDKYDNSIIDEELLDKNMNALSGFVNKYKDILGDGNVNAMIVPTSGIILSDKLPRYASTYNQLSMIDKIQQELGDNYINVVDTLKENKDEYIYYKTDHHWTSEGAFLAYEQWAKETGIIPFSKDEFEIETVSDTFRGTIFSKINIDVDYDSIVLYKPKDDFDYKVSYDFKEEEKDSLYEMSYVDKKDKYSLFLNGNNGVVSIKTNVDNDKKLLIIKDSYANCFVPFAVNHFSETYVIDLRFYKADINALISDNNITDILVLYNCISFAQDNNIIQLSR